MDKPPPPPSTAASKLRLMCSYGGHIVPRPRTKSLCYAGGETRIISINPITSTSLSALTAHLSSTLSIPQPFILKYQLPHHDLDSLISLSTDEDLLIMLDELHRLSSTRSRIRLFLFRTSKNELKAHSVMHHPKTESWFFDTLKSAKVMQKRRNSLAGFDGDAQSSDSLSGGELSNGIGTTAESMVLETISSFESISSSASSSNLAPISANVEDNASDLQDNKAKVTLPESIPSGKSASAATSTLQIADFQDPAIHLSSTDNRVSSDSAQCESRVSDVYTGVQAHKTVQSSECLSSPTLDHLHQQQLQYVHVRSPYIQPQNTTGLMPISSFYPLSHPQMHQQQFVHLDYQPNHPLPLYYLPVAPTQPYHMSMHGGFIDNATIASGQNLVQPNASYIIPQVKQDPILIGASPNLASQVYKTDHLVIPDVPSNENQMKTFPLSQVQQQPQFASAYGESPKYSNEFEDAPGHIDIYKSQPPPPSSPSKFQSMTNAPTILLSEALAQLHLDNKQQIGALQPR